jgi:hypothetical protein
MAVRLPERAISVPWKLSRETRLAQRSEMPLPRAGAVCDNCERRGTIIVNNMMARTTDCLFFHKSNKMRKVVCETRLCQESFVIRANVESSRRRRKRREIWHFQFLLVGLLLLGWASGSLAQQQQEQGAKQEDYDYLSEKSVVLITGAAGFLGSELSLALHRTYSPKKIICVDRMGDHPETQEELALFEFQRQRSFHVLQTLGSKGRFYRVDFRPMIPEYFDLGEVPVLDHIFREHSDITHVVPTQCLTHPCSSKSFREKRKSPKLA